MNPSPVTWNIVNLACKAALKGEEADKKKNYREAIEYYERAEGYFIHAMKHEAVTDKAKDLINSKCKVYQKRMEKIRPLI